MVSSCVSPRRERTTRSWSGKEGICLGWERMQNERVKGKGGWRVADSATRRGSVVGRRRRRRPIGTIRTRPNLYTGPENGNGSGVCNEQTSLASVNVAMHAHMGVSSAGIYLVAGLWVVATV
jgi:hypothetical protein